MKHVIIGNGPAAVAAAEAIRGHDPGAKIVIISREKGPAYSPCPLAEYVEGSVSRDSLFIRDQAFYEELGIDAVFGRQAKRVDTRANQVVLAAHNGAERIDYDRLLIALGARPARPPVPGIDIGAGVFALKTLADADALLGRIEGASGARAVVVGSGFIGLEAAQALVRRGLEATIVEAMDRVLPQMLDAEAAGLVQARLEDNGIDVRLDSPLEAVLGDGRVGGVVAGGKTIECELVVLATGVRPDLSVVEGADIATDTGILIDDRMETSQPGVFAAGDIVEAADVNGRRRVVPNWPNAVNGGRVAGHNMAGVERRFAGLVDVNVVRVFGMPVGSFGRIEGARTIRLARGGVLTKLTVEDGRIAGMQSVGSVDGMGVFLELMKKGRDVAEFGDDIVTPEFGYARLVVPPVRPDVGYMALRALN